MQQQFQRLWQSALEQGTRGVASGADNSEVSSFWRQFGTGSSTPGPDAFNQWLPDILQGLLRAPLQGWPAAFSGNSNPFAGAGWSVPPPSEFAGLTDLPPLGLNRESEIRWRELFAAYTEQADAAFTLNRQLAAIFMTALKRFQKEVTENNSDAAEITSLRELYDLWVSIAESAYAEKVMTAEYSQAFGNCINSSARARKAWQVLADEAKQAMNLPNRQEIDSIIERQHALQAEVRSLETRLANDTNVDALNARIKVLAQQLDDVALAAKGESAPEGKTASESATAANVSTPQRAKLKRKRSSPKRPGKARTPSSQLVNEFDIGGIKTSTDRRIK